MYVFDHRMIEGQPLHYFYPYEVPYLCGEPRFKLRMEIGDELVMPGSPISTQSDSDNSLSSIEVSPKPIRARSVIQHTAKSSEIRCCWQSCGISFESLEQLSNHVSRTHASSGPGGLFYCGWEGCSRNNKGFNARYKMLVHVRTHTNEKPHQCCQCDKSFSRAENLKIHSRSHSGEKPYVCPVPGCNKAYSNSSDRFKHTRTHQVEKPYQCKVPGCSKRYTDPSSLRKHVKTYKHFVNENATTRPEETNTKIVQVQDNLHHNKHPCDCTHKCCTKSDEIYRINYFKADNRWDEYFTDARKYYVSYDIHPESMDIDTPLDLSINRKII